MTEKIWFGSRSNLAKLERTDQSLQVILGNIQASRVVLVLGVFLDLELTIKQHVTKTSIKCFYHIRRLCQVRRRVGLQAVSQQLVVALIMSRLDYCNSVLVGLPESTLEPLQCVHNSAAQLCLAGCQSAMLIESSSNSVVQSTPSTKWGGSVNKTRKRH